MNNNTKLLQLKDRRDTVVSRNRKGSEGVVRKLNRQIRNLEKNR